MGNNSRLEPVSPSDSPAATTAVQHLQKWEAISATIFAPHSKNAHSEAEAGAPTAGASKGAPSEHIAIKEGDGKAGKEGQDGKAGEPANNARLHDTTSKNATPSNDALTDAQSKVAKGHSGDHAVANNSPKYDAKPTNTNHDVKGMLKDFAITGHN